MNRNDIREDENPMEEEPHDLLDDLVEDSERVFHHDMAKFQLNQQKRYDEYNKKLHDWADVEFKKGATDGKTLDLSIETELKRFRNELHEETKQYMIIMDQEKKTRDEAIGLFVLHKASIGEPIT